MAKYEPSNEREFAEIKKNVDEQLIALANGWKRTADLKLLANALDQLRADVLIEAGKDKELQRPAIGTFMINKVTRSLHLVVDYINVNPGHNLIQTVVVASPHGANSGIVTRIDLNQLKDFDILDGGTKLTLTV